MALQVVSDLHLESPKAYDVFTIVPRAPHLALLGDIGNVVPHKADLLSFLTQQLTHFRTVLFVPGNHEAYSSDWPATLAALRTFEEEVRTDDVLGEFVLLDRRMFRLPDSDVTILACSLFSSVPLDKEMDVSMGLNDFFQTDDWDVGAHNAAHERDLAWLNATVTELEQSDAKVIILTHWSPTVDARSTDPKHAASAISSAFSTDLAGQPCFNSANVKLWAFGHTHYNCDFKFEREGDAEPLRLLANQRGYYFAQAEGFDGEKIVQA
ncbi:calcineurin-like phosphoesterase [Lophiotrema nucula]|uniref:Calcineurin-like phosphoesterase n=1 Tax=Lophiotrema nucula TaxID=690887 RepID=A0A6A5YLY0_9PLEO|nr:calcineurin-like phosphoesterase [Lophiotrema nucula]